MKFSIITVVYNDAEHIEQTIKSVIEQPEVDVKYIIIDGGSIDGTVSVIKKYEKYLSYWVSEPDKGIYDAMNKGLNHITGDIIPFLNSGDWYEEFRKIIEEKFMVNKKEKAISILIKDKNEDMRKVFPDNCVFYIWGMGNYGRICYELLSNKKYNIMAFIDSNKEMVNSSKVQSYTSDKFMNEIIYKLLDDTNNIIIVTPRIYESEIKNEIIKKNIN